jgi:hypothetical protein
MLGYRRQAARRLHDDAREPNAQRSNDERAQAKARHIRRHACASPSKKSAAARMAS